MIGLYLLILLISIVAAADLFNSLRGMDNEVYAAFKSPSDPMRKGHQ